MKKLQSSLVNMVLSLTLIVAVATGILAYVNQLTAGPIAEANKKALNDALKEVLVEGSQAGEPETYEMDGVSYKIYKADKDGQFAGAAVESSENGFGGALTVLVGFDKEGNIINYSVLNHAETPGLGSKSTFWFKKGEKGDITGKNPGTKALTVSKDGGEVEAITASTITSRAFLKAVNNAYAAYSGQHVDTNSGASQQKKEASAQVTTTNQ